MAVWQAACEYKQKKIDSIDCYIERDEKIKKLRAENSKLRESISYLPKVPTQPYEKEMAQKIQKLKTENDKLRECVEFYADEANQIAPIYKHDGRNRSGADFTAPYRMDEGKRARQVLKELEEK